MLGFSSAALLVDFVNLCEVLAACNAAKHVLTNHTPVDLLFARISERENGRFEKP
jgi:hypothetical protein